MTIDNFSTFKTDSFQDFELLFGNAKALLDELKIPYNNSRIEEYTKDLSEIVQSFPQDQITKLNSSEKHKNHLNTLYEVSQINHIYKALSQIDNDDFRDQLNKMISGPISSLHETIISSSNEARNSQFELYLLAIFIKTGKVKYKKIKKHDISFIYENKIIIIECKRIQSTKKIQKNINKAKKQIENTNILKPIIGIIALDISKLINPDFKIIIVNNKEYLNKILTKEMDSFCLTNSQKWNNQQISKKVVAIILRLSAVAYITDEKLLTFCTQLDFRILSGHVSTSKAETVKELFHHLNE